MAADLCSWAEDSLIAKHPKKNPLVLRMLVVIFVMVCGVYICAVCLRQIGGRSTGRLLSVQVADKPCDLTHVEPSEKPYIHFPKPKTFSREECACNPVRYFAILSTQRSGSGWFETLLNSHMNISSNGEIFSVKLRRSNISTITETLDKIYNLDWMTSASKNECTAAVGLKWMLNQAEILASFKPSVNTSLLMRDLNQVEDLVNKSMEYFKSTRHIILYYEDIINNRTKLVDVQNFLRVPLQELSSRQVKIHKGSLSSQVDNWADIDKALKGTRYESFLNEDYKS